VKGSAFFYRHTPRLVFQLRKLARANYEREMELLDVLCDRNRTGVDVGAKVGMYTYRIRARSSDVLAFEPIPMFNRMLRAVFDGKRGRVEPYAVSRERGTAVMRLAYDADGSHLQFGRSTIDAANPMANAEVARVEELEVETRTIDEYELPSVGFIKIDVEGHELAVLDGATRTIERSRPNMLIECNDDHQPDAVAKLRRWLDEHGYTARFLLGNDLQPIESYEHAEHWKKHGIENFMCVHRDRDDDTVERLRARAAQI
jgi:FkbM family methyltransferase